MRPKVRRNNDPFVSASDGGFLRFAQKRLDNVGSEAIRKYQAHLLEERKLEVDTVAHRIAALWFLYVTVLKRPSMKEDLPYPHAPKHTSRLPTMLTKEEVSRVIDSYRTNHDSRFPRTARPRAHQLWAEMKALNR